VPDRLDGQKLLVRTALLRSLAEAGRAVRAYAATPGRSRGSVRAAEAVVLALIAAALVVGGAVLLNRPSAPPVARATPSNQPTITPPPVAGGGPAATPRASASPTRNVRPTLTPDDREIVEIITATLADTVTRVRDWQSLDGTSSRVVTATFVDFRDWLRAQADRVRRLEGSTCTADAVATFLAGTSQTSRGVDAILDWLPAMEGQLPMQDVNAGARLLGSAGRAASGACR
jgi:hypothetical protein